MRWKNKGHVFDEIGKRFEAINKIYIYGAGAGGGIDAAVLLKGIGADVVFVDRNKAAQKKYLNIDVITHEQLEMNNNNSIIVLSMGLFNTGLILKQLELKGYVYGKNLFDIKSFLGFYIYIIALYKYKKCIMLDGGVMAIYRCSLKCKNCMGGFPYMSNPPQVSLAQFKKDADIYFNNIDYTLSFGLGGAEIMMCKNLDAYIEYVMENYAHQIWKFSFLTNGTILPVKNIIELLKRYQIDVVVSNYSSVKNWEDKFQKLKAVMNENGVHVRTIDYENWINMGWTENTYKEDIEDLFDICGMQCRVVHDGKLNYCIHGMTSNEAIFHADITDDEFDLLSNDSRKKYQLVEYHLGFNKNGDLKMCHYCNGYININHKTVSVAEQLMN